MGVEICDKVCRGEGWIEEWNEEIIVPMVKKGEGVKEKYRGVTLTSTLYKMRQCWRIGLREKLKKRS